MVQLAATSIYILCPILFKEFTLQYHKTYLSDVEMNMRQDIFCKNYEFIQNHNSANNADFLLDVNEYTDLTDNEFSRMFTAPININDIEINEYDSTIYTKPLPDSFDWRDDGHVSIIKNQGQCGSCWTFGTTGAVEAHLSIHKNEKILLSEQELVDCSWIYANLGCNGGLVDRAYRYIVRFGLSTEENYPYTAQNHMCKYNTMRDKINKTFISNWYDVSPLNETRLTETLYNMGPISVAIDASSKEFRFYKSGIFNKCGYNLDHAVLLVGYGQNENGDLYYTLKNSWGETFGDQGYIKISRGINHFGTCGVAMTPSYPIV